MFELFSMFQGSKAQALEFVQDYNETFNDPRSKAYIESSVGNTHMIFAEVTEEDCENSDILSNFMERNCADESGNYWRP